MAKKKQQQEEEQDQLEKLEARVAEIEGDLRRLVVILSKQFAGPVAKALQEVAAKKQGR